MKRRCMLAAGFVLAAAVQAALGAPVKVTVDFAGAPSLTDADKTAIIDKMKAKYTGIDVDISTAAGGAVTVKFTDTEGTTEWGEAKKRDKSCVVHVKRWALGDRAAVFDTDEKRRNLWSETGAHELGHLLCAVHNKDDPVTLMTIGDKVTWAKRAEDGRAFNDKDKANIAKGIAMLQAGKSWDLDAKFDKDDLCIVPGAQLDLTEFERDDTGVAFDAFITNTSFGVGFLNEFDEYIEFLMPGQSMETWEFDGGELANFALRAPDDSIIPFSSDEGGFMEFSNPLDGSTSYEGFTDLTYFQTVQLNFQSTPFGPVSLLLDASSFYDTGGFYIPAPGPAVLVCGTLMFAAGRRRAR